MGIRIDELSRAVAEGLSAYSQAVTDGIKTDVKRVARECAAEARDKSPRKTGRYAKGWAAKTAFESGSDIRVTVYNRTAPQLTHLLEHGHAKAGGGRVAGRPHIAPAEQAAAEKLVAQVRVRVRNR